MVTFASGADEPRSASGRGAVVPGVACKSESSPQDFPTCRSGMTGAQVARGILEREGIYDVEVERVAGFLSDHYDPRTKTLRLSPDVYDGASVASAGVAAHEAGHAIVGRMVPEHDPVYKVSIIPRGRALGVTMFLPEEDRHSMSRQNIHSQICSLFGGRIAEEMVLGKEGVTTGASNDIERATGLARNMVTKWGLSDKMGPLMYDEDDGEVFLGMSAGVQPKPLPDETATAIEVDATHTVLLDACPGDLDGNGSVGVDDLLSVIAAWNSKDETGDADGNGYVDVSDLLVVISGWGTC